MSLHLSTDVIRLLLCQLVPLGLMLGIDRFAFFDQCLCALFGSPLRPFNLVGNRFAELFRFIR